MQPMLASLREQGIVVAPGPTTPPGPIERALARYRQYLIQERGLRHTTARGYVDAFRPCVRGRITPGGRVLDWQSLNAADVTAFVVGRTPSQPRGTAKLTVTALRSFLTFLHVDGLVTQSLTTVVSSGCRLAARRATEGPAARPGPGAPGDRRTRTGRRDFAVLTILIRLGLRAGEVAALRLSDIDWRAGTVLIRGKGPPVESLPWPADVGDAVVRYLRQGRPATAIDRTVFVRVKAPHRALSSSGMTEIVAAAARRAGLGVIHAHRLRHTTVTQLHRAGAPLPEIGKLLRHPRALTTAIYAKVDRVALRTIARPWPIGLLAVTGMRVGEALALDRDDIDAVDHVLTIRLTKVGKIARRRCKPFSPTGSPASVRRVRIRSRPTATPCGCSSALPPSAVVSNRRNWRSAISTKTLSPDALERRLRTHVAIAVQTCPSQRQQTITLPVLRHTAAMRLLHAGVDTSVIALWLGHEQVETTQIYLHADLARKERLRGPPPIARPSPRSVGRRELGIERSVS